MRGLVRIGYGCIVLLVAVLFAEVIQTVRQYKEEQKLVHTTLDYIYQLQESGSGDYLLSSLDIPADASPVLRCLVQGSDSDGCKAAWIGMYDRWSLALMAGLQTWENAITTGDLLDSYEEMRVANKNLSSSESKNFLAAVWRFQLSNAGVAEAGRYAIALDFLLTYGNIIDQQALLIQTNLTGLEDRIILIQEKLKGILPENWEAQQCIEEIQKVMLTSMRTSQDLRTLTQQTKTRTKTYISTCLESPDPCVESHEIYFAKVVDGFTLMHRGILQYIELYDELLGWLQSQAQDTLQRICNGDSSLDNSEASSNVQQWVSSLRDQWESADNEAQDWTSWNDEDMQNGKGDQQGIKHRPFSEEEKRYLQEIYERELEYLEQRESLQKQPGFSIKWVLQDLFQEFYGNEDEFDE